MLERLKSFEEAAPEIVFEWSDPETDARGWAVINSLRGGAAGGGTRMRKGLNKHEVMSLAKTMEVKFAVCGPHIGGAKSGIDFDPNDPRKSGVLRRWYKALLPLLQNYYGTGGDLNVDEIKEVLPITAELGLFHCQEGVVAGHFGLEGKEDRIARLQNGVSKKLEDPRYTPDANSGLTVADMITGWGVAEAVRVFYDIWNKDISGKRVVVQGFGNVGGAAAYYLAQLGLPIVGIIDISGGIIRPEGISLEEIRHLLLNREGNKLSAPDLIPFEEMSEKVWSLDAEIFLPCARSRMITREQVYTMAKTGMEVLSCGANVPFADEEIFLGPTSIYADGLLSVIPDFIANCGMARAFNYFMGNLGPLEDHAIFQDVTETIRKALSELNAQDSDPRNLGQRGLDSALETLLNEKMANASV